MAANILPDQQFLRECFDYASPTGVLRWRVRPLKHFPSQTVQRQWCSKFSGKRAGSNGGRYRHVGIYSVLYPEHRIIWKLVTGEDPEQVDHIDCDGFNNAWNNLRSATCHTNARNQRGWSGRTLPKGVVMRENGKFRATIQLNKIWYSLGSFVTADEAAAAYTAASIKLHGEFANHGVTREWSRRRG